VLERVFIYDPVNRQHSLNRGRTSWLLALPPLDGGKFLYDLVGLTPGTLTAVSGTTPQWSGTYIAGGAALSFSGTAGEYVDLGTQIQTLTGGGDGSVGWWQKITYSPTDSVGHWSWGQKTGATSPEISVTKFSDNNIYAGFNVSGTDQRVIIAANSTNWPTNVWCRYLLTWVSGGITTLYLNGAVIGTNGGTTTVRTPTNTIVLGTQAAGVTASILAGQLADFAVWNRCLTAADAREDYAESSAGYPNALNRLPRPGPYLFGSSAANQAFAATLAGIGSATLAVVREAPFAASLAETGSATLAVVRDQPAAATLTGVGSAILAVFAERFLAAAAPGVGLATLGLTTTHFAAATLVGVGLATLTLSTNTAAVGPTQFASTSVALGPDPARSTSILVGPDPGRSTSEPI
jgi:hypothetical protein